MSSCSYFEHVAKSFHSACNESHLQVLNESDIRQETFKESNWVGCLAKMPFGFLLQHTLEGGK